MILHSFGSQPPKMGFCHFQEAISGPTSQVNGSAVYALTAAGWRPLDGFAEKQMRRFLVRTAGFHEQPHVRGSITPPGMETKTTGCPAHFIWTPGPTKLCLELVLISFGLLVRTTLAMNRFFTSLLAASVIIPYHAVLATHEPAAQMPTSRASSPADLLTELSTCAVSQLPESQQTPRLLLVCRLANIASLPQ